MKKKIIDVFKEPFTNRENVTSLIIGGVITLFPVFNFISLGYLGTKLKKSIQQDKTPVKWDENIKGLFITGLFLFIILISYLLIPFLLMFLGGSLMLTLSGGKILSLFYFRGQILNLLGIITLLIALYFLPFTVCVYLEEGGDINMAFKLQKIMEKIFLVVKEYTIIYLIIIGLLIISVAIIFLFMNWIAGLLLSGFIFFYDGLVITGILSKIFPRKAVTISLLEISDKE
ncbi:MAG: DUF4013 domain-containing protein [Candidatus Ratteibacteria bacterium]|nr:DUF4013 domain-containing protein [Candidatus Ratteibacteria bacterium]